MSDLDIFFPVPRALDLREHNLKLLPLRMGQTPAFLKAVAPAYALLQVGKFLLAVADQYDSLRDSVCIATGLTAAEVAALYSDEFLDVLIAVIEVNLSFFVQRAVPRLNQLIPLIVPPQTAPAAGPVSSPASSGPVTA